MTIARPIAVFQDQQKYLSSTLMCELKNRSRIAFDYLYLNYAASLNGVISRSVKNTQAAEKILENVFMKIWLHIDQYEEKKASLFAWMLVICRNEVVDYLPSGRMRPWRMTRPSAGSFPEKYSQPFRARPDLMVMLPILAPGDRVIIDLIYGRGFSFTQTAELLSMPVASVKIKARAIVQKWEARTKVRDDKRKV